MNVTVRILTTALDFSLADIAATSVISFDQRKLF